MKQFKITQTIHREAIFEAEDEQEAKDFLKYKSFGFAWKETKKDSVITEVMDDRDS